MRGLGDLAKFPFTTKIDLRDTYPFGMFAVPMERIVRIHASSGTTGKPTVVGYTAKDIDTWSHVMARSMRAAGGASGRQGARRLRLRPVHRRAGRALRRGASRPARSFPLGGGMTERQVQLIADFKPDIIMVTPSYMLAIADEMERQGLDPQKMLAARRHLRRRAVDRRACARRSSSALRWTRWTSTACPRSSARAWRRSAPRRRDGLTIWEDHFYPEIIDPATGAVLPDGENGELVLTSLTKEALPVIRYRTRDLTRLLPGTARTMRRMEKITGRSDDMLIIRGVNVFPSQIEELILKEPGLAPHYVLEITKQGPHGPPHCGGGGRSFGHLAPAAQHQVLASASAPT